MFIRTAMSYVIAQPASASTKKKKEREREKKREREERESERGVKRHQVVSGSRATQMNE